MVRLESLSLHTSLPPAAGPARAPGGEGRLGGPTLIGVCLFYGSGAVLCGLPSPGEVCLCWDVEFELKKGGGTAGRGW